MLKYFKKFLSFSLTTLLCFICSFPASAIEVPVEYKDLNISFVVDIPKAVIEEMIITKDVSAYTHVEDYGKIIRNYRPMREEWLNSLIDKPLEFFKAYVASAPRTENRNLILRECLRREKNGELMRFGFCRLEDRAKRFKANWEEIRWECQKGVRYSLADIDVPVWSGWYYSFAHECENDSLSIRVPISELQYK